MYWGKLLSMGQDSIVIGSGDEKIELRGIDFTENISYEDMATANKSHTIVGIRDDVN